MKRFKSFLKSAAIFAVGAMMAFSGHAQIPFNNKSAGKDFGGSPFLQNLQLANLGIVNGQDTPARMNIWGGRYVKGAVIGNYPSDVSRRTGSNEDWSMHLIADGRFTLRPSANSDLCLTVESTLSSAYQAEFGDSGRAVRLQNCDNRTVGQHFFLQVSGTAKKTALNGSSAYVLRPVDDPHVCLTTFSNTRKSLGLSPLTVEPCTSAGDEQDRWVITSISDTARAGTQKVLNQLATVWALHDYSDSKGVSIYNKAVTFDSVKSTLKIDPTTIYKRLQFASPFNGSPVRAFTNATPTTQDLHIERFDTSGFDKSIEISGSSLGKIAGLGFFADIKGKLDWKSSKQENVKLWQTVPEYSTMYFAAGTVSVSGGFNVKVVTDLGDTWESVGGTFSEDVISTIVTCTDTSTSQICAQVGKED